MRRTFNGGERWLLFLKAKGKCSTCGSHLTRGWHADHIVPWSKGGATVIANGQALCRACNLKKGDSVNWKPRKWQEKMVKRFMDDGTRSDFSAYAVPAAGKTAAAAYLVNEMYSVSDIDRVIVVVPTSNLRNQWHESWLGMGIQLEPNFVNRHGAIWPRDFKGIVTTYASVASNPELYRALVAPKTFVILDEVHHCGVHDQQAWGAAVRLAFSSARYRLLLSGTPYRDDGIPFIKYVDGVPEFDITVGYGEALREGWVRGIEFPTYDGVLEWIGTDGDEYRHGFDDDLFEREENQRLRTAVTQTGEGSWLSGVLESADAHLSELRRKDPDAGGIIFCRDQDHARRVQSQLDDCTVVVSDDDDAPDKLKAFKNSRKRWIATVKMVSEGVDIKRLRIGVYATTTTTRTFFMQALGRVLRISGSEGRPPQAWFYLPKDGRLSQYAKEVREIVLEHIREINERPRDIEDNTEWTSLYRPLSGEAIASDVIGDDGVAWEAHEIEDVKRWASRFPLLDGLPLAELARMRRAAIDPAPLIEPAEDVSARRKTLRRQNQKLGGRVAMAHLGGDYEQVNTVCIQMLRFSAKTATVDQLERRLTFLQRWLRDGEPGGH
jgi:superfamily II DNA or RNA helicase